MDPSDARAFHDEVPVIDLHADTPKLMHRLDYDIAMRHQRPMPRRINYAGHIDLPRMRDGGVAAQIFGLWTAPYPQRGCALSVHQQLDALDRAAHRHAAEIVWALTDQDIHAAKQRGQIACLAGIEGGQALEGDLDNIEAFAARGVRYIGLLHFSANQIGTPAYGRGANADQGLTDFGKDCVREMNRCGVILDLAHINRKGFLRRARAQPGPGHGVAHRRARRARALAQHR
jgi:membrane dipeptidase